MKGVVLAGGLDTAWQDDDSSPEANARAGALARALKLRSGS
jgi:hypothetical protein